MSPVPPRSEPSARPRAIVATLTLAALAYATMQMMVVPALPAIQRDLGAQPEAVAWLVSAFLISTAIATPVLGRLGDQFGKERVLVAALAIFTAGGVLGAFSSSLETLIAARAVQGCGGAVFPLAFGVARDTLPRDRVPVAIGIVSGSFGVGGSAGLVLCGPLVDHFAWQAIFWVGIALPLVAIAGVLAYVPSGVRRAAAPLDWGGAVLLGAGIGVPLVAIANGRAWGWGSPAVVGLLAGGVVVLALWARWELRRTAPLVDVRLLARRTVWPANAIAVLAGFGMYSTGYLVPQLVQADPARGDVGFGASVTATTLVLLPALLAGLGTGTAAGALTRRFGARLPLALGGATMVGGYAVLALAHHVAWPVYLGTLLAHGIGLNLVLAAMANVVVAAVPAEQSGEAAGVNTMLRTVGGALGAQIAAAVAIGAVGGVPSSHGFLLAFALCGVLMAGAVGLALLVRERPDLGPTSAHPMA